MSRARIKRAKLRAKKSRRIHIVVALSALIIIPILVVAFGGLVATAEIMIGLPKLKNQDQIQNWQTTKIFASNGTLLTNLFYEQDRVVVPLSDISPYLQHAVIAIEDERFYKHKGYDPEAIARAFFANLASGHTVEGASTITQQYIKNTIVTREKTFDRKIKEAALANQLEQKYTKAQILEKYLNTIYFGHSWYGVETASNNFFGKRAKMLSLPEAAMLAAIIKSPNDFSPYAHMDKAKERRDLVLQQMARLKYITPMEESQSVAAPVKIRPMTKPITPAPYFVEYVKQKLIKRYGENVVFKGGLRVYTTISLPMQQQAEQAAWSTLDHPNDPSASIVAVEPATGYIRAMVGGRDFNKDKYNLATSHNRQPGSSFKPIVFAAAVENGISPFQEYSSSPGDLPIGGGRTWHVDNYVEGSGGPPMALRDALVRSVNTVFARLILDVGVGKVTEVAKKMGMPEWVINQNPAIALGGFTNGPSPLDMASVYSTFANGGMHCPPEAITRVTDASGKIIDQYVPKPQQTISEATAYIVTDVLQDVIRYGTGTRAAINRPCAGKTGTASSYRDAWFCGYTPGLAAAVWVGYPKGQISMYNVHGIRVAGGTFPAQIWARFMSRATANMPEGSFVKPRGGIENVLVCTDSGLLPSKYCPDVEYRPFLSSKVPTQKCPLHKSPGIVAIPNVVGLPERAAIDKLDQAHFGHSSTYREDGRGVRGIVTAQVPGAGERARQGVVIQITVSTGGAGSSSKGITVPDIVGLTSEDARQQLESTGLKVIEVTASPYQRGHGMRDKVLSQSPSAGSALSYGQPVTIYINRRN